MAFPPVVLALILLVGPRGWRQQGHPRHRADRLDAVLPRHPRRRFSSSAGARLCPGRAARRLQHAQTIVKEVLPAVAPAPDHPVQPGNGHRRHRRGHDVLRRLVGAADIPRLGVMIADARAVHESGTMGRDPTHVLAIFVTVLGFNLSGDGLRRSASIARLSHRPAGFALKAVLEARISPSRSGGEIEMSFATFRSRLSEAASSASSASPAPAKAWSGRVHRPQPPGPDSRSAGGGLAFEGQDPRHHRRRTRGAHCWATASPSSRRSR